MDTTVFSIAVVEPLLQNPRKLSPDLRLLVSTNEYQNNIKLINNQLKLWDKERSSKLREHDNKLMATIA